MPILNDILEHEVLGREYKKGELNLLRRLVEKRFGIIPSWAEARLTQLSATEVETTGLRLLDAKSLEELLG